MMAEEDWLGLLQGDPIAGPEELRWPIARALVDAIARLPDFALVRCSRLAIREAVEVIVLDVESNAVPPKNAAGIEFRERVGLLVYESRDKPIEVVALRPGFPRLMHQNARPPDWPPSLCLYFEPHRSVMRTWTAESFLQRLQIWLEKTARGELHPADQPVEQVFFTAPHELILPWNVDELMGKVPLPAFEIIAGPVRKDDAQTYFLVERDAGAKAAPSLSLIHLHLPAVVHGRVEADPPTLGELGDLLDARGVNLLQALKDAIFERIGEAGVPASQDMTGTILLLHMGITRGAGQPVEKTARRAYVIRHGALKLGELTGTLFAHEKKYFRESKAPFLAPAQQPAWRALPIAAIEVIRGLDRPSARLQSGAQASGPKATLVGAGALGATLLDLWVRAGWGEWTAIDKDHIKPHNLVRHPADQRHLGMPKEEVAVQRCNEIMNGAGTVVGVHADACELVDGIQPLTSLQDADLVVDVSTTLEYPRLMSERDDVARHASVFLTPKANGSVVLLEDSARATRLRTLEAQYYRAVMEQPWGADHLAGNLGTFWSGAGCRDISVVMPYSAVVAHAGLLAEQVRELAAGAEAAIRVWTRDAATGAIAAHSVPVSAERRVQFDDMDLFIDHAVVDKMHRLREAHLPNETGGILLGYHDLNINAIVVVDALEAPPDSRSTANSFERGVQGVADIAKEANRRTAGIVGYIGEWHSHPPGHRADPSGDDFYQLAYLALGLAHDGLPAVSLIVGAGGDLQALKCSVRS